MTPKPPATRPTTPTSARRPAVARTGRAAARGRTLLALLVAAAVLGGCNTPQIPLPPPSIRDFAVRVHDRARSLITIASRGSSLLGNAEVSFYNPRTRSGIIAGADGEGRFVTLPFEARDGDELRIQYRLPDLPPDEGTSEAVCAIVRYASGALEGCSGP